MTLGLKKPGKYEVEVYTRLDESSSFTRENFLNVDDVTTTANGELNVTRLKQGGEFDGSTQRMILFAPGFWSYASAKLQEEPTVDGREVQ